METQTLYDLNASRWLRLHPSSLSDYTARPKVFEACGNLEGQSVLDIGCGEGYCARALKQRGAEFILGLDLSSEMIKAAEAQESIGPLGIEYRAINVLDFKTNKTFDLCIAVFLFNYLSVAHMRNVMSSVFKLLNPGGRFIFTIPHPFFPFLQTTEQPPFYFSASDKNYFTDVDNRFEGKIWKQNGEPLAVQCVHKTYADYFEGLAAAGFDTMPSIQELRIDEALVQHNEAFFSPLLNVPLHTLFKVYK